MQVFRLIQPAVDHAARPGLGGGLGDVELRLDPSEQGAAFFVARLFLLRWGHLPELQLVEHFLPAFRDGAIRPDDDRQVVEPAFALLGVGIMTIQAVFGEERLRR